LPSAPRADWWNAFGDPQLNSLIERAVLGNLSLHQTVLRIAGARQQLDQARGAWAPSASGNARFSRQQLGRKGELESQGVDDRLTGMGNADSL
ncbi:RND transporter, partial [Erwinia amylovora]|nr:RND transporter [Erwinia amylovora]